MMTDKEKMRARMFELALLYTGPMYARYLSSQKTTEPKGHEFILEEIKGIAAKIEKLILE